MKRTVTAALVSAALLSGCGTGLEAQTYKERKPHPSAAPKAGDLHVQNFRVLAPEEEGQTAEGGRAVVVGTIVNGGTEDDFLKDAYTDVAETVVLQTAEGGGQLDVPAGGRSPAEWALILDGLTQDLQPGRYITLTLEFDRAGRTTFRIPIEAGDLGLGEREPEQEPYGEH